MVESIPALAAVAAAEAGAPVTLARSVFDRTEAETRQWTGELLDETEIEPPPGCVAWSRSPLLPSLDFSSVTDAELAEALADGKAA
jgi:hypothetical protein